MYARSFYGTPHRSDVGGSSNPLLDYRCGVRTWSGRDRDSVAEHAVTRSPGAGEPTSAFPMCRWKIVAVAYGLLDEVGRSRYGVVVVNLFAMLPESPEADGLTVM